MFTKNAAETEAADLPTEIALFRYGLIAQLVHTPPTRVSGSASCARSRHAPTTFLARSASA